MLKCHTFFWLLRVLASAPSCLRMAGKLPPWQTVGCVPAFVFVRRPVPSVLPRGGAVVVTECSPCPTHSWSWDRPPAIMPLQLLLPLCLTFLHRSLPCLIFPSSLYCCTAYDKPGACDNTHRNPHRMTECVVISHPPRKRGMCLVHRCPSDARVMPANQK